MPIDELNTLLLLVRETKVPTSLLPKGQKKKKKLVEGFV